MSCEARDRLHDWCIDEICNKTEQEIMDEYGVGPSEVDLAGGWDELRDILIHELFEKKSEGLV